MQNGEADDEIVGGYCCPYHFVHLELVAEGDEGVDLFCSIEKHECLRHEALYSVIGKATSENLVDSLAAAAILGGFGDADIDIPDLVYSITAIGFGSGNDGLSKVGLQRAVAVEDVVGKNGEVLWLRVGEEVDIANCGEGAGIRITIGGSEVGAEELG